jgi:hypothetical protein
MHIDGDLVIVAVTLVTTVGMATFGPIGRALAERLRGRVPPGALLDIEERLDDVAEQVVAMQRQFGELVDRQEFSDRLLAQARERGLIEGPR